MVILIDSSDCQEPNYYLDPENVERVYDDRMRVFGQLYNSTDKSDPIVQERYSRYYKKMPKFTFQHSTKKTAGQAVAENESTNNCLAFQVFFSSLSFFYHFFSCFCYSFCVCVQGTMRIKDGPAVLMDIKGSGHHGVDYIGAASVRSGKGYKVTGDAICAVRQI